MPTEDLSILTQRFPFRKPIALTASQAKSKKDMLSMSPVAKPQENGQNNFCKNVEFYGKKKRKIDIL